MTERVRIQDVKPFAVPARLSDLRGPRTGVLTLPRRVYWGPVAVVDIGTFGDTVKAYQATIREAGPADQAAILNEDRLREVWSSLLLPSRVRSAWEQRFAELESRP